MLAISAQRLHNALAEICETQLPQVDLTTVAASSQESSRGHVHRLDLLVALAWSVLFRSYSHSYSVSATASAPAWLPFDELIEGIDYPYNAVVAAGHE